MEQLEIALNFAKAGVKVFPCDFDTKAPLLKGGAGYKDATTDTKLITKWWTQHKDALIGAPNDQFTVIDSDEYELCTIGKFLNASAIQRMKDEKIITDACMTVITKSGGRHFYFKKNPVVQRSIKCLPSIDLLGEGGYVVLPDQKTYVADVGEPWTKIKRLPVFKHEDFSYLADEFEELSKAARELKKSSKSKTPLSKSKTHKNSKIKAGSPMMTDIDAISEELDERGRPIGSSSYIDYDCGEIKYIDASDTYHRTSREYIKANHNAKLLKNGKIEIGEGDLSSTVICQLFHNREIQTILARKMGLKVTNGRTLQNSILPDHVDRKASMGVRWSADGSHLIVRDFSNFYGSKFNHCDYNLVRLYGAIKYKANVQRQSAAEFVIWFTRMLVESDIIDISTVKRPFYKNGLKMSAVEMKLAESFKLLDACKRLYGGYCGETTFSDKFAAAWGGVSISNIGSIKTRLINKGLIEYTGVYDCSAGKRDDGFFNTPLYRIVSEKPKGLKIDGVILNKEVAALKNKRREEMAGKKNTQNAVNVVGALTDGEKQVKDDYPTIGTVYKLTVAQDSYETIKNFCTDSGIENVVTRKSMIVPILVSDDFIEDVIEEKDRVYSVSNIRLFEVESIVDEGKTMLVAEGDSQAYDMLWEQINKKHWDHKDDHVTEPVPFFVISPDISGLELDLSSLELKLNRYIGNGLVKLGDLSTLYLNHDEIDNLLDGIEPEI